MTAPAKAAAQAAVPREIIGPRVRLRPLRLSDARATWEAIEESRSHLEPWLPWVRKTRCLADERRDIARMQALWRRGESLVVGIFDRRSGRYLGGSGLHRINWKTRSFEIGYWIRVTAEGRGYVAETVRLLTRLAFDRLDANRVQIFMQPQNVRSEAVPKRLGFVREGTLRAVALGPDGTPQDRHVYALVRADYDRVPWRTRARRARR